MAPEYGIIHSRKEGTYEEVIEVYHAWDINTATSTG
jgi:hypothetical protein